MKKVFRTQLSFSAQEFRATINLGDAGLNLSIPRTLEGREAMKECFGVFGVGSNNFNTFYPQLNVVEDVMPKPEDYVDIPFRLLSATIVAGGSWRSTDFSGEGVLEASIGKMLGKPVYVEHDTELANCIGLVTSTKYTPAFTDSNGMMIPSGMDGILSLDAKANPALVRNVLTGAIYSESVTVDFNWTPSHQFDNMSEFEDRIGTYAKDGKMVCRKVTNIVDYFESSLVFQGADPFAKKIESNGDLRHVDLGSVVSLSKEDENTRNQYINHKKYSANGCLSKEQSLYLAQRYSYGIGEKPIVNNMDKKLLLALCAVLGVAEGHALTEADVAKLSLAKEGEVSVASEELTKLRESATSVEALTKKASDAEALVATLTAEKETINAEKSTLEASLESLKVSAAIGDAFTATKRAETERLYKLNVETAQDSVLSLIGKATSEELDGLLDQYSKGANMKFKAHCKKCNSAEVSFQSSVVVNEPVNVSNNVPSFDDLVKLNSKSNNVI